MPQTVDTSMYANLGGQNPLGMLQGLMQLRQAQNQNMQFQQEFGARMAMGHIMQQSVDPETGQPDYAKAATLASQDPQAAYLAPDLMNKAVTIQGVETDNLLKKMSVAAQLKKSYGDTAAQVVAQYGDSVTPANVTQALTDMRSRLVDAGIHSPDIDDGIIKFMGSLPTNGQAINQRLQGIAQQGLGAADTYDRMKQNLQTVDAGGQTHLYNYRPQDGRMQYIGPVGKSPTPGEMNAPQTVVDQQGNQSIVPRSAAAPMTGTGPATPPMSGGGNMPPVSYGPSTPAAPAQGALPPPGPQGYDPGPGNAKETYPGSGTYIDNGPAQPASAAGGNPTTGLGPLRTAQLKNVGDYQDDLNKQVTTINQNIQAIQKLQDLSSKVHLGMFADERTEAGRFLKSIGLPSSVYNAVANGDLSSSQQIMKYSVPNAMNTLRQSLGNQSRITNMEFGAFQRANPNLETDPDAFNKILNFTHQLMRQKQQEQQGFGIWQQAGKDPVQFQNAWTNQLIKRGLVRSDDDYTPYKMPK